MINNELKNSYKKLCFYVEEMISHEILKNIKRKMNNFQNVLEYEVSYFKNRSKDPSSFFGVGNNIINIIYNEYYPIERKTTKYSELILEECKILYVYILKIINENSSKEEKIMTIKKYKDVFDEKIRIIFGRVKNQNFELFDELIYYFGRGYFDDNIYYGMKEIIVRQQYNFAEFYSLLFNELLKKINKRIETDIENLVVPYIKTEFEQKEEKVEQDKEHQQEKITFR